MPDTQPTNRRDYTLFSPFSCECQVKVRPAKNRSQGLLLEKESSTGGLHRLGSKMPRCFLCRYFFLQKSPQTKALAGRRLSVS